MGEKLPIGKPCAPSTLPAVGHRAVRLNIPVTTGKPAEVAHHDPGHVKKTHPTKPLSDKPLSLKGIITNNQYAEISSLGASLRNPEGSRGPGVTGSRRATGTELTEMRKGLYQTNAKIADMDSLLTAKMVGMDSHIANIIVIL